MKLTLEEIAKLIDAKVYGESSKEIMGMNTLDNATSDHISHAVSQKYKKSLIILSLLPLVNDNSNSLINLSYFKDIFLMFQ